VEFGMNNVANLVTNWPHIITILVTNKLSTVANPITNELQMVVSLFINKLCPQFLFVFLFTKNCTGYLRKYDDIFVFA
jgi:hypothetical protein